MQKALLLFLFLVTFVTLHGQKLVVQGEYFWDTDPGTGNGTALVATDGNFDAALENVLKNGINVSALSVGAHSFQVRIKGQDGTWSSVFKQTIYVEANQTLATRSVNVIQGEYFWDTDPGTGNGIPVLALDGNFNTSIEEVLANGIGVGSLSIGAHSFQVRIKGFDGTWGNVFKQTIYIESTTTAVTRAVKVGQAEYFWDTDPGTGNGTVVLAFDGNYNSAIEDLLKNGIIVASLSVGPHSFCVRVKGNDGTWSAVFKQTIAIEATPVAVTRTVKVLQGEYFWDADPGSGNGTVLLALDGNFDNVIENVLKNGIDVSALTLGAHAFNVRIKGNDGSWSNVFKQAVYLEGTLVSVSRTVRLTQGEYFWDTDPGDGNGTPLLAVDGNFDASIENLIKNAIDVSSLALGAHSFQVRVKGQNGSWSGVFKQTIFIECSSPTAAAISISSTQNGQCQGSQSIFNATATNGGTSPTYTWKVNGAVVGTNSSTLTISSLNNGDLVTCELISNSACASPNTATSNVIPVTLSPIVVPTISISSSVGSSICIGTSVTFTASATNAGTPSYQWKVNGIVVGTNSSQYTTSNLNNGDLITCLLTGSLACSNPQNVTSNVISMTVSPIVSPLITVSASSTSICQGTTVSFTASAVNGGATPNYQWKVNGINVGNNSPVYSSNALQNGDVVSCVFTSSLACTTTASATSNSITISVSPSVAASVSIVSANGTTVCQGTAVTFTATPVNGGTIPNYQWQVNGFNVGFNQASYSTASLANGDVVACLMTSTASCPSPITSASNVISMTVNSNAAPTVVVSSAQGTSICSGSSVTLTATPSNGGSSPSYQWQVNGLNVGTNAATFSTSSLAQGDAITCLMTSNATCASGQTATSNALSFTVTNNVSPSVTITNSASTICQGGTVTFTATPTNGGVSPAYQWKINGVNVGGGGSSFSTSSLQNSDVVTCVLTSSLACVTSASATSNAISINVLPSVATAVSINTSSSTVCQGVSVNFTATPTNGGTSPSYQWQINGANTGTNSSAFSSSSLQNGDIITCFMTSNASCPNPSVSSSNAIAITVNSTAAPTVSISAAQGTSICSGTSVFFTATPTNGGSSPNYQWKINGNNVGPNSAFFNTNTLVQGDIVTCVLTSNASCINGQTASSNALIFSVTTSVTPTITIASNTTTACQGSIVSFTSTTLNGGLTPSYQWKVNGINVGTNSSVFSTSSLQNGDIVTCILTSSIACVSSSTVSSNAITISMTSFTPASVSISGNSGTTICQGTSASFTAVAVNGGSSPAYQWQINGFNVGTNSSTFASTSLQNGDVVSCLMTSNALCPSPAVSSSNSISMTVNAATPPSLTISSNQGVSICAGTSVIFTAAATNGGSSPSYQWKVNGIDVGTNQAFYSSSTLVQGDVVTCVVTSNANCVNGQTATSNALVFTVTPIATPTITINSSTTTICQGALASFTASTTFGGTNPSYQWLINGIPAGNNSSVFNTTSLQNGDVVSCILTSSYACVTAASANSNPLLMVVNPSLATSVSIASNLGSSICQGTAVTFTATTTNGGTTPSYQWQINGSNVGTNSPTFSSTGFMNGDNITCYMTSNAACPSPAMSVSNGISMSVSANLTPTISITASETMPVCVGTSVSFIASIVNGGTSPSYQWQINGVNAGSNTNQFTPSSLANGDVVSCILTSNAQCLTTATATSNAINFQETTVDVSLTQTSTSLSANQAGASYQWINCTTMTPVVGQTQQNFTGTQSGNYAVQITLGSCVDTSACVQYLYNGLPEENQSLFSLYPNPASTEIYISSDNKEAFELSCTDVFGRLIQKWSVAGQLTKIDLHELATGTYYFTIQRAQYTEVHKVIVFSH